MSGVEVGGCTSLFRRACTTYFLRVAISALGSELESLTSTTIDIGSPFFENGRNV